MNDNSTNKKPTINYKIRKSLRARLMRITVYRNFDIVVTLPRRATIHDAAKYIKQKAKWILAKINNFQKTQSIRPKIDPINKEIKEKAYQLVVNAIDKYNKIYDFNYNKIRIKSQRTKWGSCSRKKNLNFNYRIAFLPPHLAEYIVVHELCHLEQLNHSKNFWALVEKTMPNYKILRKELKKSY
ncbi:MAG: M48 family metallopeptidase [Candidatus Gracilibacteria bacterium]|jgi:hypothetical protein